MTHLNVTLLEIIEVNSCQDSQLAEHKTIEKISNFSFFYVFASYRF